MVLFRGLSTAVYSLWGYKVRTTLAILGILMSSLLLTFLLSVLHNFKASVNSEIQGFGLRQIVAMPGRLLNDTNYQHRSLSSLLSITTLNSTLSYQDAVNVKKQIPQVTAAVPQTEIVSSAHTAKTSCEVLYTGTTPDFTKIFRLDLTEGRWLNSEDVKNEAQSIVLGAQVKQLLFGNTDAVGKKVTIKGVPFTVVGVLAPKEIVGLNFDDRAYTEYQMVTDTTSVKYASMIYFSVAHRSQIDSVSNQIRGVITRDHGGSRDFMLVKADQALHFFSLLMELITAITIGIAGVSFVVSGIGIMNVMLLVVKERTREIGLRKAVGAKSYHVLFQFLSESLLISIVGAILGVAVSVVGLRVLHHVFTVLSARMPLNIMGAGLLFSVAIGLVFGLAPAIQAVRVQPIEALRYE
ncbi:ABC transporter permease [Alicyclobacillus tolerans]|uniref:ABC transporter permease n=1 Tax=Alicyclobacillus tolerans TaxID=90970 RepID=UPI001F48CD33|nr:ABC transporter permease [Alicyclobacillus tolerans]MCF8568346.1 ABC transporter permease [Alicyclobacillus tolerans]